MRGAIGEFGAPRSGGRIHEGFDVVAACGTPLVAVRNGRVLRRGYDPVLYGNYLLIHGEGERRSYFYAHLPRPAAVRRGERVWDGRAGRRRRRNRQRRTVGCHLHFEIHVERRPDRPGAGAAPLGPLQLKAPFEPEVGFRVAVVVGDLAVAGGAVEADRGGQVGGGVEADGAAAVSAAIRSSSARIRRPRPRPRWAGQTYMLFTSATAVSRWRTPPIAAGRRRRGQQQHPGGRHQVARRPGGDLGLDVDQSASGPSASRMKSS